MRGIVRIDLRIATCRLTFVAIAQRAEVENEASLICITGVSTQC